MTTGNVAQKPTIAASVFLDINRAEGDIAKLKKLAKDNSGEAHERKVDAYSSLVHGMLPIRLVKGNLPRAISKVVLTGLTEEAGVKSAVAKKYLENSVGLLRKLDIPTQATPSLVKDMLLAANLTSESKIARYVTGEDAKDELLAIAEKLVGKFTTRKDEDGNRVPGVFKSSDFTERDFERFDNILRELKASRSAAEKAAAEAGAKLSEENDAVGEVLDAMGV